HDLSILSVHPDGKLRRRRFRFACSVTCRQCRLTPSDRARPPIGASRAGMKRSHEHLVSLTRKLSSAWAQIASVRADMLKGKFKVHELRLRSGQTVKMVEQFVCWSHGVSRRNNPSKPRAWKGDSCDTIPKPSPRGA